MDMTGRGICLGSLVIDVKTKQIVATLQDENGDNAESEKMLEIDFANGKPSVAGDQFGKGKKR
jgi:hypothetical protein